ncbi:hypothetical protein [Natrarchaeobius chitinivorans]|uniref:hypothetical protein n=1 Tax=Natrarchaeobius chitinivorans TaxID=1679083 RepID=UPI001404BBED|nr:hypothetical protein [Natrarchaeobius chitinivorans]
MITIPPTAHLAAGYRLEVGLSPAMSIEVDGGDGGRGRHPGWSSGPSSVETGTVRAA